MILKVRWTMLAVFFGSLAALPARSDAQFGGFSFDPPAINISPPKVGGELGKIGGEISDGAKHAGGVVSSGTKHAGGVVSSSAKHAGGVVSSGAKHAGGVVSGGAKHAEGVLSRWGKGKAGAFSKYLKGRRDDLFMQQPHITVVNPGHYTGDPVYYINGVFTTRKVAVRQAEALSCTKNLRRPVYLIFNRTIQEGSTGTPGCVDDISEAVYDKLWPEKIVGLDLQSLLPALMLPNPPFIQLDPTTREVTWVLFHSQGPVSIVSQSQGCLQVRNAILAAALLGRESYIRQEVAWVATGNPLNDAEIWPIPAKYHYMINAMDPVSTFVGVRGGPGTIEYAGPAVLGSAVGGPATPIGIAETLRRLWVEGSKYHEPVVNYFPRIVDSMLFGKRGVRVNSTLELTGRPTGSQQPKPVRPAVRPLPRPDARPGFNSLAFPPLR